MMTKNENDDGASLLPAPPLAPPATTEALPITIHVCGGTQARICPKTGKAHDMSTIVRFRDGGSVACKDCGVTAMSLDLLELP